MKRLGVFLLPLDGTQVNRRITPQHFVGTHLYTWVEGVKRGTVRLKCAGAHETDGVTCKAYTAGRVASRSSFYFLLFFLIFCRAGTFLHI